MKREKQYKSLGCCSGGAQKKINSFKSYGGKKSSSQMQGTDWCWPEMGVGEWAKWVKGVNI